MIYFAESRRKVGSFGQEKRAKAKSMFWNSEQIFGSTEYPNAGCEGCWNGSSIGGVTTKNEYRRTTIRVKHIGRFVLLGAAYISAS